tara:strand:+ start:842 stop:1285 length:444 start_codon:yes stop_codon:yes gene_type:complete
MITKQEHDYQNTQDLKQYALDNMKYSARRYDVVCLVFTGFNLYANYELYKTVNELNLGTSLLFVSTLLLLVIAFMSLYVLRMESSLQADWVSAFYNIHEKPTEKLHQQMDDAEKQESKQEFKRGIIYVGLILCVVLTIVGFVVLSLG